nr:MAG TPA: protein of unknown function (DUF4747) [Caudoviricetes sp.]
MKKNVLCGRNKEIMVTKQMAIADLNLVFGKDEDPMIKWVDDIVLPALQSGISREAQGNTKYFFWNVELREVRENEYAICGLLIKHTVLDVNDQFHEGEGLEHLDLHIPSSPYSAFMIYLKNHKMALVKNGKGSPNLRNFSAAFRNIIVSYTREQNEIRRKQEKPLLPFGILNIAGIKTDDSIRNALQGVEKVKEFKVRFFPLNSQWDDGSLVGAIDERWRKVLKSNTSNLVFNTPQSLEGVITVAEQMEGLADVELTVEYPNDGLLEGKNTTKIKNGKLAEKTNIDLSGDLDESFEEIDEYCKRKKAMTKVTNNLIIDYEAFLEKRRKS